MIRIYTDGACSQNGTWDGGWGMVAVKDGEVIHQDSGSEKETTNNRMEMTAFIKALEFGNSKEAQAEHGFTEFVIITDSAYIVNAFVQKWVVGWVQRGWLNAKREPVKNKDLWLSILLHKEPKIEKVKGHAGDKFNEIADDLAVAARVRAAATKEG